LRTSTSTDVDDRKQAEQTLQRSRDELEEKVRERTTELLLLLKDLEKSRDDLRKLASERILAEERERKSIRRDPSRRGCPDAGGGPDEVGHASEHDR
jgi:hypothetical protein